MLKAKIRVGKDDTLKRLAKQHGRLFVGYTSNHKYDAIDEPFYANVAKPNTKGAWGEKIGKPRKFYKTAEKTAAEVAAFNEFGGGNTPPRPFIRTCLAENGRKWVKFLKQKMKSSLDANASLWSLGDMVRGDLSETVKSWSKPPNSPRTVAIKGFNNPLVDSGNMSGDFIDIEVNGVLLQE